LNSDLLLTRGGAAPNSVHIPYHHARITLRHIYVMSHLLTALHSLHHSIITRRIAACWLLLLTMM